MDLEHLYAIKFKNGRNPIERRYALRTCVSIFYHLLTFVCNFLRTDKCWALTVYMIHKKTCSS